MNRNPRLGAPLAAAIILTAACATATAEEVSSNWPSWRGPRGDGHSAEAAPVRWDSSAVVWKRDLKGIGQSSPVIWGDRIFLTTALDDGAKRVVFCVDRNAGRVLWERTVSWSGEPEKLHGQNSWASPTCVTDGERVIAFFGRGGLHAYSVDGEHLWSRDLGSFVSPWGVAACPILVGDLVVQNGDSEQDAFIAGIDKRTGEVRWRTPRPNHRGWSTPIVVETGDHKELVVNGHAGVTAYDPTTGRQLWFCKSFNGRGTPTITPGENLLFAVNGLRGDMYAITPGGEGDVTSTKMAWHTPRSGRDLPSPILIDDYLLVMSRGGILTCYNPASGEERWEGRIGGTYSASPIAAGGKAYFLNENGETVVVQPGEKLNIAARNQLDAGDEEIFRASPTPSDGQMFIRSTRVLYCIGNRQ